MKEKDPEVKKEVDTERALVEQRNQTEGCDNPICVAEAAGIVGSASNEAENQQPGEPFVAKVEEA